MVNIRLVCNLGLSTSMVVKKMQEAAKKMSLDVSIEAIPETELKKKVKDTDVVLLGPQISYKLNSLRKEYGEIKIEVINGTDYAMMNGEKVLKLAMSLIEKK